MAFTPQANPWKNFPAVGSFLDNLQTYLQTGIASDYAPINGAVTPSRLTGFPSDATKVLAGDGAWKVDHGLSNPKVTTGPISAGPPASPSDGDIWIATNVDVNGTRWQFQYDANWTTDANKWKFIGGPPTAGADPSDFQETVTGAWTNLHGGAVSLSIARPGFYMFEGSCRVFMSGTNCTFDIGDEFNQPFNYVLIPASGNAGVKVVRRYFSGIASPATVHMMYYAQNSSPFVSEKVLTAIPVRIS